MLALVESRLKQARLVTDLSTAVSPNELSAARIREAIGDRPYLQAEGDAVIEDYKRMLEISEKLNDLIAFSHRSFSENTKGSEYKQLEEALRSQKQAADQIQDRAERDARRQLANATQRKLEEIARLLQTPPPKVEQWALDGLRLWVNTFMPNRITLRIFPFSKCPSFQVLCNLKKDCFVDSDLEHLLYGYGRRPNVRLAVVGLVTSLPTESGPVFDSMREFTEDAGLVKRVPMEKAYRDLFEKLDAVEADIRFARYPNVSVHPIAVYRSFAMEGTSVEQ